MMTKDIINLIMNNSDLPIYAYVAGEVVGEPDSCFSWLGKVTSAKIANIATVSPYGYYERDIVELEDSSDYFEYLINSPEYLELSDKEAEEKALEVINNLEYKRVILLNIGVLDNE